MPTPDIWLTPAQAVHFLITGDLAEAERLSDAAVLGKALQVPLASVPSPPDAGPMERVAAVKLLKERASEVGDSPLSIATRWRDRLLATGQVPAVGRPKRDGQPQYIMPADFAAGLRIACRHAVTREGEVAFFDVLLSGAALMASLQATPEGFRQDITDRSSKPTFESGRLRRKRAGPKPTAEKIVTAAKSIISSGRIPSKTVTWQEFQEEICHLLKVTPETRGYGLDTIQKAVKHLIANKDGAEST